ncbi:MAG: hypothetical protein JWQ38_498 [Flavipsychrobacter sp.]|nr:hypothetical protein [Flavipsychrobacter sp.]
MDKKQHAHHLYMTQGMSQKQIAKEVGVSERTIYTWIHQYAWEELKRAAYQAPAKIADNFYSQLIELQDSIAKREPGNRFPTPQEAEVSRKLLVCIEKLKKTTSLPQSMQVLESFRNFTRNKNPQFTKVLVQYTGEFLEGKAVNNYAPYDLEYGVEQVLPTMPFYEEPEEEVVLEKEPCYTGNAKCLHPETCNYPVCRYTEQDKRNASDDPLVKNRIIPIPAVTEEEVMERYQKFLEDHNLEYNEELQRHFPIAKDPADAPEKPKEKPEDIGSTLEVWNNIVTTIAQEQTPPAEAPTDKTQTPEIPNSLNPVSDSNTVNFIILPPSGPAETGSNTAA